MGSYLMPGCWTSSYYYTDNFKRWTIVNTVPQPGLSEKNNLIIFFIIFWKGDQKGY